LYQADWSGGLGGWGGGPGWQIVNGMLVSDRSNPGTVISPPYVPPISDYAVEAEIQIGDLSNGDGWFGIALRAGIAVERRLPHDYRLVHIPARQRCSDPCPQLPDSRAVAVGPTHWPAPRWARCPHRCHAPARGGLRAANRSRGSMAGCYSAGCSA